MDIVFVGNMSHSLGYNFAHLVFFFVLQLEIPNDKKYPKAIHRFRRQRELCVVEKGGREIRFLSPHKRM